MTSFPCQGTGKENLRVTDDSMAIIFIVYWPAGKEKLAAHSAQLMPDAHEYWNTNTTIL